MKKSTGMGMRSFLVSILAMIVMYVLYKIRWSDPHGPGPIPIGFSIGMNVVLFLVAFFALLFGIQEIGKKSNDKSDPSDQ